MIKKVLENYNINGELVKIEENNSGNINRTYVVKFKKDEKEFRILVQKINTTVFTQPYKLMANIDNITTFINKKLTKMNDSEHKTLNIIKTKNNDLLSKVNGEYYRVYNFIENAEAYNYSTDLDIVRNTGVAFGNFQKMLADYPMNKLEETIRDFHNTPKRLKQLLNDIKIDCKKRTMNVAEQIVFILQREDVCSQIMELLGTEEIPLRVTHNDTKVNNVLMNKDTGKFMAVIDLDTVMPGSLLFDYGDGIRSTASNAKEDETDLNKVYINLDLFEAYTDGFLSQMAEYLTETEVLLMGESVRIITLELAIRFLNDYINGDTYFKIDYETHNLDRANNQLKLVKDIEEKLEYMNNYINQSYKKYKKNYTKKKVY